MKFYVVSETTLREFLDRHAQGMTLEDEDASVLRATPVIQWASHNASGYADAHTALSQELAKDLGEKY
jgi:hypothetical protein